MANLYNNIEDLCKKRGVNVTTMCRDSGASRGSLSDLKSGRKQTLKYETLEKIANYFEISVESLVSGDERQKEKPAPGEGSGLDADVEAKAHTILDKLSKLPTKQQEAFLNSLDISIDAALNMMDGNGNG